jgi:hypothetical protein
MKTKISVFAITVLALTLAAAASSRIKTHQITLHDETTVAGTSLKPGEYQIAVDGGMATFFRDGKEVAKVEVQSEDAPQKAERDEIVVASDGHIEELHFAGSATKWMLGASAAK